MFSYFLSLFFTIRQIEEDWDETPYVFLHNILGSDPSSLGTVLNKLNSDRLQWLARHIIHRHGSATVNLDDLPTFWKYAAEYKRDLPESFLATSTPMAAQTEDLFRGASQKRSGKLRSADGDDIFDADDKFSAATIAAAAVCPVLGKENKKLQSQEERSKASDGNNDYRNFLQQNGAADSSEARRQYEARNRDEFLSFQERLTAASANKAPPSGPISTPMAAQTAALFESGDGDNDYRSFLQQTGAADSSEARKQYEARNREEFLSFQERLAAAYDKPPPPDPSVTPGDVASKRKAQRHHQFFWDRVGAIPLDRSEQLASRGQKRKPYDEHQDSAAESKSESKPAGNKHHQRNGLSKKLRSPPSTKASLGGTLPRSAPPASFGEQVGRLPPFERRRPTAQRKGELLSPLSSNPLALHPSLPPSFLPERQGGLEGEQQRNESARGNGSNFQALEIPDDARTGLQIPRRRVVLSCTRAQVSPTGSEGVEVKRGKVDQEGLSLDNMMGKEREP